MPHEPEAPLAETVHEAAKESRAALFFVIIMAVVQLISVAVYTYNAVMDRSAEREEQKLNRQLQILNYYYIRQDKKFQEIEYPLISLRTVLYQMAKTCQDSTLSSSEKSAQLKELKAQRLKFKIALIQAYGASQLIFGPDFYNRIRDFVEQVERTEVKNNEQLCAFMNSDFYEKIKKDSEEIEVLMSTKMKAVEIKIKAVLEKEEAVEV